MASSKVKAIPSDWHVFAGRLDPGTSESDVTELLTDSGIKVVSCKMTIDAVLFGPFKTYYHQACDSFMMRNPGKRITEYDVAALFNTGHQHFV